MKRSRRRFLKLLAAGSAAVAAAPAAALTHSAPSRRPARPAGKPRAPQPPAAAGAGPPPAVAEEIARQKAAMAQALQALRDVQLPVGSEPAFRFVPLRPPARPERP